MPDELIYSLIDQTKGWKPFSFTPFKVSEPLLDKRLYPILQYLNKHVPQARTRIFTNGAALTHKRAEELHNINNLELWISLNTHRKEEYGPLMSLDYDRVVGNIDMLHESDFRHEVHILRVGRDPEFVKFVNERWPYFEANPIKKDGWLGYVDPDIPEPPDMPCGRWFELSIMATGVVALCCMDSDGTYAIGDVTKSSLLDIYNAPEWRERRENMLSRKLISPCNTCSY